MLFHDHDTRVFRGKFDDGDPGLGADWPDDAVNDVRIAANVLDHPGWELLNERTGYRYDELFALWCLMVRHAAERNDGGLLSDWNDEDAFDVLGMTWREVADVRAAMQGIFLDDMRLRGRDETWRIA